MLPPYYRIKQTISDFTSNSLFLIMFPDFIFIIGKAVIRDSPSTPQNSKLESESESK